jgi:hypothetical protein
MVEANLLDDLFLADFVDANKRWGKCLRCFVPSNISSRVSQYHLMEDSFISCNLRGLLERGVQKSMDVDEPRGPVDPSALPLAIEAMLGYTGSIGTALWHEIGKDHGKVGQESSWENPFPDILFHSHLS